MARWRHTSMTSLRISVADAVLELDSNGHVSNESDVTPAAAQKMRSVPDWKEAVDAVRVVPAHLQPGAPNIRPVAVEPEPAPAMGDQNLTEAAGAVSAPPPTPAEPRKGRKHR